MQFIGIYKRIAAGVGANAYGQAITIGVQLLALPVYLHYWDAARYGTWLMLSAMPAYFTMADVGMLTAAGNKMTMEVGRGDLTSANRIFQSALVFMAAACLAVLAITAGVLTLVNGSKFGTPEYKLTVAILVGVVLLAFFNGLAEAVFRATGRYGIGTALGQSIRLGEWIGGMLGLWWNGGFVSVALGMLLARAIGVCIAIAGAILTTRQIRWGTKYASASEVRAMIMPAGAFMVFPIVNALSVQGFTLLVGGLYGSVTVALFNTYRTMARLTVQATSTLSAAVGPEMSRLYGASNREGLRVLFQRVNRVSAAFAIGFPLALAIFGPNILLVWTHGRIPYHRALLFTMLLYAAVSSAWHVPRALLLSINRHFAMAGASLVVAVSSLVLAWILGTRTSLDAVVWVMVVGELILAVAVHQLARTVLTDRSPPVNNIEAAL